MNGTDGALPILRLRDIGKILPTGKPLLDIDELSIHAGRCLLLTGANGTGKTTLLKILSGLVAPDRALVDTDAGQLSWPTARARFRREVIYLHQEAYLFDRSVTDNVTYGLRSLGLSRAEIAQRVHSALEWGGLSHLAARNARELSGGEQQRVALTRAMVLTPRVLLLDEPFSGLDEESRNRTGFLIQRLKSERVGVVVTSHELWPLSGIADEHFELRDGRLVAPARGVRMASAPAMPDNDTSYGNVVAFKQSRD